MIVSLCTLLSGRYCWGSHSRVSLIPLIQWWWGAKPTLLSSHFNTAVCYQVRWYCRLQLGGWDCGQLWYIVSCPRLAGKGLPIAVINVFHGVLSSSTWSFSQWSWAWHLESDWSLATRLLLSFLNVMLKCVCSSSVMPPPPPSPCYYCRLLFI